MSELNIESDVRALFDRVEDAWGTADLKRYGSYFLDDAGYVNRSGQLLDGRAAIEGGTAVGFARAFAGTTMRITPLRVRRLCDTHALAHVSVKTAAAGGDGVEAIATTLLQRTDDGWCFAAVHMSQLP